MIHDSGEGKGKTISIYDWFDPDNTEHVRAYKQVQDTGMWPKGFIPEHVEMTSMWSALLASKMADAWVAEKLKVVGP